MTRRACLGCGAEVVAVVEGIGGGGEVIRCRRGHAALLGWAVIERGRVVGLGHAHVAGALWSVGMGRLEGLVLLGALGYGDRARLDDGRRLRVIEPGAARVGVRLRGGGLVRLSGSTAVAPVRLRDPRVAEAAGLERLVRRVRTPRGRALPRAEGRSPIRGRPRSRTESVASFLRAYRRSRPEGGIR